MIASRWPRGRSSVSLTAPTYWSTSRVSAPAVPGYQVPATAAGRIESVPMAEILTRADVERIAALARLELTPEEVALFAEQLTAILGYADQIQQVDTSLVPSASVTTPGTTVFRDDLPADCLPRDLVLSEAPAADTAAGLFK